jgi:Ni,Fe-hydrogenase III small subunit
VSALRPIIAGIPPCPPHPSVSLMALINALSPL